MHKTTLRPKMVQALTQVTRVDGTVEPEKVSSYWDQNFIKTFAFLVEDWARKYPQLRYLEIGLAKFRTFRPSKIFHKE